MKSDDKGVGAALKLRFGTAEHEIERMLRFYVGGYETVAAFVRDWLTERLDEQAGWMLQYIHVRGAFVRGMVTWLGLSRTAAACRPSVRPVWTGRFPSVSAWTRSIAPFAGPRKK